MPPSPADAVTIGTISTLPNETPPDRLGMAYKVDPSKEVKFDVLADSIGAVRSWVKRHLPAGTYTTGNPYYQAFANAAPQQLTFAGDPGYRDLLVSGWRSSPGHPCGGFDPAAFQTELRSACPLICDTRFHRPSSKRWFRNRTSCRGARGAAPLVLY